VKITGNRHFDQRQLADQVAVRRGQFLSHGKFSNDLVSRSVSNLTAYYRNAGYADVQVQSQVVEHEPNVDVTFRVSEGDLTRVETLEVQGNKAVALAKLAPKGLGLKAGQPYSQTRLDRDRSQVIATYLELGYPNATFRWSVKPLAGSSIVLPLPTSSMRARMPTFQTLYSWVMSIRSWDLFSATPR